MSDGSAKRQALEDVPEIRMTPDEWAHFETTKPWKAIRFMLRLKLAALHRQMETAKDAAVSPSNEQSVQNKQGQCFMVRELDELPRFFEQIDKIRALKEQGDEDDDS